MGLPCLERGRLYKKAFNEGRQGEEAGLKPGVVYKLVREEGWRSLRRKKVPLVSSEGRKKRASRAAGLLIALKEGGQAGRIIFFSDEKTFVVDPAFNPQNDRYICYVRTCLRSRSLAGSFSFNKEYHALDA